ncbi:hypothetical protein ACNOYE_35215 [Nannocystaceae bacterium ST9]
MAISTTFLIDRRLPYADILQILESVASSHGVALSISDRGRPEMVLPSGVYGLHGPVDERTRQWHLADYGVDVGHWIGTKADKFDLEAYEHVCLDIVGKIIQQHPDCDLALRGDGDAPRLLKLGRDLTIRGFRRSARERFLENLPAELVVELVS